MPLIHSKTLYLCQFVHFETLFIDSLKNAEQWSLCFISSIKTEKKVWKNIICFYVQTFCSAKAKVLCNFTLWKHFLKAIRQIVIRLLRKCSHDSKCPYYFCLCNMFLTINDGISELALVFPSFFSTW